MSSVDDQLLVDYANVSGKSIYSSQADLNPKDHAHPDMLVWCRRQQNIVVLQSGTILTSEPTSRNVQNCKIILASKGLKVGPVCPARQSLIQILLENAEEALPSSEQTEDAVSLQQQRLRLLVQEALAAEATDIHVEVREEVARIRFRRHGELYLHAEWLPKLAREVVSVAFNKETDNAESHFSSLVPQSASMPLTINGEALRLRLACLPAQGGFDVVMRLLTTVADVAPSLAELGYDDTQTECLARFTRLPYGAVIVAGPTGSGKTTTLASCMQLINSDRKLYTIEDPVEKIISTASQIPVNTKHYDRTFANMARTVLRMDPDVIVLGEMRDEDTAAVMTRAAITGHLIFSTLHVNAAIDCVLRLTDFGVSRTLLASPGVLAGLVCQRLYPVLCEHCAEPLAKSSRHQVVQQHWQAVGIDLSQAKVRGAGCESCAHLGIQGRKVVAEIIEIDEPAREFIANGNMLAWEKHLRAQGWQSYRDMLMTKVQAGLCDPLDAEKLVGTVRP